jgi:hypothetical protein
VFPYEIYVSFEAVEGDQARRCPACGMPYPTHGDDLGCPVCLLRQAAQPEATVKYHEPTEDRFDHFKDGVRPIQEEVVQRFEHYELVTDEDGKPVELGRGPGRRFQNPSELLKAMPTVAGAMDAAVESLVRTCSRFPLPLRISELVGSRHDWVRRKFP